MRQKRASARHFRIGLGIYALLLCIGAGVAVYYLYATLTDYQANLDAEQAEAEMASSLERAPQEYFQAYFDGLSASDWAKAWSKDNASEFDSADDIAGFVDEHITSPELSLFKAPGYTDASPVYLVRSEKEDIATFTLSGSGFDWTVSSIVFHIAGHEGGSITVPSGCRVLCNGTVLDDSFINEEDNSTDEFPYTDSLVNPVKYATYTVDGLINAPNLTTESLIDNAIMVNDADGNLCLALSSEASQPYKQRSEAFVRSLLYYYAQGKENSDENMASVLNHVPGDSDAAKIIRMSYDGVQWRPAENISYATSTSDAYIIADNCYCVDVTYTKQGKEESASSEEEADGYRVYFLDLGSGYKIYSFGYM